jgi:hypothetical protein
MRYSVIALCLITLVIAPPPGLHSQSPASKSATAGSSCPSSTTLEELTKALDEAVSGPAGKDRTCLRELMLPDARLTPIRKADDGTFAPAILTLDDWINSVAVRGGEFYERQVKVQSETYGHFAHMWSTYVIRPTPDGKASVIGINSVQAVYDGARWRVLSVLWEPDTTAGPVPEKYLP